jgi:hypothetical protein
MAVIIAMGERAPDRRLARARWADEEHAPLRLEPQFSRERGFLEGQHEIRLERLNDIVDALELIQRDRLDLAQVDVGGELMHPEVLNEAIGVEIAFLTEGRAAGLQRAGRELSSEAVNPSDIQSARAVSPEKHPEKVRVILRREAAHFDAAGDHSTGAFVHRDDYGSAGVVGDTGHRLDRAPQQIRAGVHVAEADVEDRLEVVEQDQLGVAGQRGRHELVPRLFQRERVVAAERGHEVANVQPDRFGIGAERSEDGRSTHAGLGGQSDEARTGHGGDERLAGFLLSR